MSERIEQARQQLESEIRSHGYAVRYAKGNYGRVFWSEKQAWVPMARSRRTLYTLAHELAHVVIGKTSTVYEGEMLAEQFARNRLREMGIPVPRASVHRGKWYVAMKLRRARRRGLKEVSPKVKRFLTNDGGFMWRASH